jgi:hypothetical protein
MSDFEIDAYFTLTQTTRIAKYRVYVASVSLHTSATLVIILFDASGYEINRITKEITGEEYEGWGTDDKYLEDIAEKEVQKIITPLKTPLSIIVDTTKLN